MKIVALLAVIATLALSVASAQDMDVISTNATETILAAASADSIDLTVINFLNNAIAEIEEVYSSANETVVAEERRNFKRFNRRATQTPNDIVDAHAHVAPAWYKAIYPEVGGNPVPDWTIDAHLSFMETQGIERTILSFSTPGPNVYPGNRPATVALARIMNEQAAAYCRAYPGKFNFYAQVPLPYAAEALIEARYAINILGAVGIWVQSNAEGKYLGDASFKPFFQGINAFPGRQILYVHPATPWMKINNKLIEANPTPYMTGTIEFYFETARTIMDLTVTQTIHNFTNIDYIIPHVGGAFPSTVDRILTSYPAIYNSSFQIYNTRFWWDSAGPTYSHQISGLLGMGVPKTQLLYGTDFPYAPLFVQPGALLAVENSPLFTAAEKTAIFSGNVRALFGNKINW